MIVDGVILVCGLYFMFSLLYIVFRPHGKLKNESEEQQALSKKAQKVGRPASTLVNVLFSQMQIVSAILLNIRWSPKLPQELVNLMEMISNVFSIDLTAMMSSPECAAELKPRQQWLLATLAPVGVAFLFLSWALCVKIYHRKKTAKQREGTMVS